MGSIKCGRVEFRCSKTQPHFKILERWGRTYNREGATMKVGGKTGWEGMCQGAGNRRASRRKEKSTVAMVNVRPREMETGLLLSSIW